MNKYRLILSTDLKSEIHDFHAVCETPEVLKDPKQSRIQAIVKEKVGLFSIACRAEMRPNTLAPLQWSVHSFDNEVFGHSVLSGDAAISRQEFDPFLQSVGQRLVDHSVNVEFDDKLISQLRQFWANGYSASQVTTQMVAEVVQQQRQALRSFGGLLSAVAQVPFELPETHSFDNQDMSSLGLAIMQLEATRLLLDAQNRTNELLVQLVKLEEMKH